MKSTSAIVVSWAMLSSACSYQVYSPPAHMVALESARTLAPGETTVAAKGTYQHELFEPDLAAGSAVVRRGIREGLEVTGEASYARVMVRGEDSELPIDPGVYAARAGVKLAPNQYLAGTLGVGGGYAPAGGGFGAIDVGGIVSYDNCWVVPFASVSGFVSQPIAAKAVDFGATHGKSTASTSYGVTGATGIEVPLSHKACREGRASPKLQMGVNLSLISISSIQEANGNPPYEKENGQGVAGLAGGFEVPF
jgi:hypothetical protein